MHIASCLSRNATTCTRNTRWRSRQQRITDLTSLENTRPDWRCHPGKNKVALGHRYSKNPTRIVICVALQFRRDMMMICPQRQTYPRCRYRHLQRLQHSLARTHPPAADSDVKNWAWAQRRVDKYELISKRSEQTSASWYRLPGWWTPLGISMGGRGDKWIMSPISIFLIWLKGFKWRQPIPSDSPPALNDQRHRRPASNTSKWGMQIN